MRWLWLSLILAITAQAEIYITVTGGNLKKARIAVGQAHPLSEAEAGDAGLANNIREQIKADLEFSGLFDFVAEPSFTQFDGVKDVYTINYDEWTPLNTSFVLKLGYRASGGKLTLEAILHDIPGKKKIFGTRYQYPIAQYVRLVHALSEDILKQLTGERGLFFSRILMSCRDSARRKNPPKEIYIADPDGRNFKPLTDDRTLSLSPSWSPDGKSVTYTQFDWVKQGGLRKKGTVLKRHNLLTGERKILSSRDGMNSGAAWSPKGDKIALTLSMSGRPEIYLMDPSGGEPEPLSRTIQWKRIGGDGLQANSPSQLFDVEPSWSPQGNQIVFSSARTGHPMIYIVDLATKLANQLTFAGQYNASPAWSPKGDKVIFSAQRTGEGNFDLYIIDPDGNNLNRLTSGDRPGRRFNNENASWAPTGRHLAYASNEEGKYSIYVRNIDGTSKKKISPDHKECTTPSWGPYEGGS